MDLKEKAAAIKMLVMDVDGTLTDGAMYYSARGEELKRFSTRDGMGITLLHKASIEPVIMTSENSEIAVQRGKKLHINEVIIGTHDKCTSLDELSKRKSVPLNAIAYIGDDINDKHVMLKCGLTACPSDSVSTIKEVAHIVCSMPGGNGAVREFIEFILLAQNKSVTLPENW